MQADPNRTFYLKPLVDDIGKLFTDAASLDDFYPEGEPDNHDAAFAAAIAALDGTGRALRVVGGRTRTITTPLLLDVDLAIIGGQNDIDIVHLTVPGDVITIKTRPFTGGVYNLGLMGSDNTNTNNHGIRIGENIGAEPTSRGNYSTAVIGCRNHGGFYDFIISETEIDQTQICYNHSFGEVGRSHLYLDILDTIANATSAGVIVQGNQFVGRSFAKGKGKYGAYVSGTDGIRFISNTINGNDYDYYFVDNDTALRRNFTPAIDSTHTEDFRPWVIGTPGWTAATTFAVGATVKASKANSYGWIFEATSITTGITGGTEPFTGGATTEGATFVDGGVTWTAKYRSLAVYAYSQDDKFCLTINNPVIYSQIVCYELAEAGQIIVNSPRTTNDAGMATDNVYQYTGTTAGTEFISRGGSQQGNIKPWKVASTDTNVSKVVREYSAVVSELLLGMPADGLGVYVNNGTTVIYRMSNTGGGRMVSLGVGGPPSATAIVDIQATTRCLVIPRMTTVQKNAISSPDKGSLVYDTTLEKMCVYGFAGWETVTSV